MKVQSEIIKLSINDYSVSVRLNTPGNYSNAVIIANGSGGNMDSAFIKNYSDDISQNEIMTVNFNFHYQEIGRKFPDKNEKCQDTYLAIYDYLANMISEDKITIGGKSMGGRIATQIANKVNCKKIIALGYPLHPPGKPDKLRDEHLYPIKQNVLIIQGERDSFGTKEELDPILKKIKNAHAYYVPTANHSLKAPKKSGLDNTILEQKILETIINFVKN